MNLAIEIDEHFHKNKKNKEKDQLRQENIINDMNCQFLRIEV